MKTGAEWFWFSLLALLVDYIEAKVMVLFQFIVSSIYYMANSFETNFN